MIAPKGRVENMTTRAPRRGLFAATALVACLAGPTSLALADEPGPDTLPISVIAIQTPDADDQAEALTKALRFGVRQLPGWSIAEGDYSLEVLTISLKCVEPPDATCQSRIADQIKADRYVWGIIKKNGPNVGGEIHMWVRGQGTTSTKVEYSGNLTEPNDEALRKVAANALSTLTGGPPKGTVHIKAGNVAGQVFIDGQPVGALTNGEGTFPMPAGAHKVVVKAPGYSSVESPVVIRPAATAEIMLTLIPLEEKSDINWRQVGGFVGIGAGVAFGVVGLVGSVKILNLQNEMEHNKNVESKREVNLLDQKPYTYSQNVCETAKTGPNPGYNGEITRICNDSSNFELLQAIMYPLAAVSAGAGLYLLMTSDDASKGKEAPKTGWTFSPKVGMESGKLDVTYRW